MDSFIKRDHWNETKVNISDYVSVDKPDHQRNMFNPQLKNCIAGYIIYWSKGKSSRKRLARRHFKNIDGNVNAYAQIRNPEERLERVRDYNMLAAGIGDVTVENSEVKRKRDEKKSWE